MAKTKGTGGGKTSQRWTQNGEGTSRNVTSMEPRAINVCEFAKARSAEINTLMKQVDILGSKKSSIQSLPRHMRRRAGGHNSKRLPRRLHQQYEFAKAKEQVVKDKSKDKSKPKPDRSRRHRRRHSNLRQEYQRRQRQHVWLETHLWHAKRFKVQDMWGVRIPVHPSDKSARATYRAVAKHCLIQDISYCGVIEVHGPQGQILQALSHLTNQQTGLTFAAKAYLSGSHHGEVMLYHKDKYPLGAICPVDFLWRALSSGDTNQGQGTEKCESTVERQLWIWVHPACYEKVLTEVKDVCGQDEGSTIEVSGLKDDLVRFRLRGPLSHPILLDALQVADITPSSESQSHQLWWDKFYTNPDRAQSHMEQQSTWTNLQAVQSSSELSPRCVMALTVRDPRILIPEKRTKIMVDPENVTVPPSSAVRNTMFNCTSPLWDGDIRETVKTTQMPQHQLNQERSKILVPGTELNLGCQESRIPVLLLQNPGVKVDSQGGAHSSKVQGIMGYGAGWDLVLPSGWAMAFWVALIYRGARAGGVRESRSCTLQQGVPHFPEDYIDTAAGQEYADTLRKDLETNQGRRPPAKRPNYAKLGISSPFNGEWVKLVTEWSKDCENTQTKSEDTDEGGSDGMETSILVVRDRVKLQQLNKLLNDKEHTKNVKRKAEIIKGSKVEVVTDTSIKTHKRGSSHSEMEHISPKKKVKLEPNGQSDNEEPEADANEREKKRRRIDSEVDDSHDILTNPEETQSVDTLSSLGLADPKMYVCVQISLIFKGAPGPFSIICLPSPADLSALAENPRYGGPVEPVHKDYMLPKKQKKKTQKVGGNSEDNTKGKITTNKLGLPNLEDVNLLTFCSRKVIGYVTNGAHAFSTGKGYGVGYCCVSGLRALIQAKPQDRHAVVLVRDTGSLQYRFANINVLV